jgi:hypothetical protein
MRLNMTETLRIQRNGEWKRVLYWKRKYLLLEWRIIYGLLRSTGCV